MLSLSGTWNDLDGDEAALSHSHTLDHLYPWLHYQVLISTADNGYSTDGLLAANQWMPKITPTQSKSKSIAQKSVRLPMPSSECSSALTKIKTCA